MAKCSPLVKSENTERDSPFCSCPFISDFQLLHKLPVLRANAAISQPWTETFSTRARWQSGDRWQDSGSLFTSMSPLSQPWNTCCRPFIYWGNKWCLSLAAQTTLTNTMPSIIWLQYPHIPLSHCILTMLSL